ncbi:hypothetical protein ECG_09252 [Echinococcus granulosus]|uniref:Secreted protein n=1 Tax=Echinococcus granulosus TaxID=6210 RepID=A0A068WUC5_ECHGR|nr:hypothetical protein ECG_09252 [Echinococcus granulosus]CDS23410.1 hypothetical protein EgrG_002040900 [Echinococcus granulosus]
MGGKLCRLAVVLWFAVPMLQLEITPETGWDEILLKLAIVTLGWCCICLCHRRKMPPFPPLIRLFDSEML